MEFEHLHCLIFLAIIPCFLFYAVRAFRDSDLWLRQFAGIRKQPRSYVLSVTFFSLSLTAAVFALSEPGMQYEQTRFLRSHIDVLIGIDISKSMLAEDVQFPEKEKYLFAAHNRLNRARVLSMNLLSYLEGEQTGFFIFGQEGIEVIPLTGDYGYCRYVLKYIRGEDITLPGSDLEKAVRTGLAMFTNPGHAKAMILFSDGEDLNPDRFFLRNAAKQAATKKIRIYTVGLGNSAYSLIPVRALGGPVSDYYRDEKGEYLRTRRQSDTLKTAALITGGAYYDGSKDGVPEELLKAILSHAGDSGETRKQERVRFDLSPLFLLAGIFFFTAGILGPAVSKESDFSA